MDAELKAIRGVFDKLRVQERSEKTIECLSTEL